MKKRYRIQKGYKIQDERGCKRKEIQDAGYNDKIEIGMKSYRDLEIYKLAKKLAVEIHKMTLVLPKFELYEEGSQIRRSSKSIGANFVEGYVKRNYRSDFLRQIVIAWAECDETLYHLEVIYETGSMSDKEKYDYFHNEYKKLSMMLNKFYNSVEENHISKK